MEQESQSILAPNPFSSCFAVSRSAFDHPSAEATDVLAVADPMLEVVVAALALLPFSGHTAIALSFSLLLTHG